MARNKYKYVYLHKAEKVHTVGKPKSKKQLASLSLSLSLDTRWLSSIPAHHYDTIADDANLCLRRPFDSSASDCTLVFRFCRNF